MSYRQSNYSSSAHGRRATFQRSLTSAMEEVSDDSGRFISLSWEGSTFHGPPTITSKADTTAKHHYSTNWVKLVSNSTAKNSAKLAAFVSRFAVGQTLLTEVAYATRALLNPDTNVFKLDNPAIFKFVDSDVLNGRGLVLKSFTDPRKGSPD
eukprot:5252278-Ditylum_brightwellii.AAC.1